MDVEYRPQMRPPGRPTGDDLRTPVAWRQREKNFHQNCEQYAPSPVSSTSEDTSSEVETSLSGQRRYNRLHSRANDYRLSHTIRSTHSVPALNLMHSWDNEPCPVHGGQMLHSHPGYHHHHHHINTPSCAYSAGPGISGRQAVGHTKRAGSMFDLRMVGVAPPPPRNNLPICAPFYSPHPTAAFLPRAYHTPMAATLDKKQQHYGSLRSLHSLHPGAYGPMQPPPPYNLPPMPPPHLLPPGMRPRPLVIPAGAEPLPIRNPAKMNRGGWGILSSGKSANFDGDAGTRRYHCCRGPLPLVWFIITIVTIGVIVGVVLGSIYG